MAELIPKDIEAKDGALHIQWSDGHPGVYPFRQLRLACQCANCVDEWTRKKLINADHIPVDIKPVKADYVGRYALNIEWSDGHRSGIFTFDYLRSICQCEKCRER